MVPSSSGVVRQPLYSDLSSNQFNIMGEKAHSQTLPVHDAFEQPNNVDAHQDLVIENADGGPMSKREEYTWYGYDFANSVYASVVIGVFLPLLVDELGERAAMASKSIGKAQFEACSFSNDTLPTVTPLLGSLVDSTDNLCTQCVAGLGSRLYFRNGSTEDPNGFPSPSLTLPFGAMELSASSLAFAFISFSVLAQAIVFVLLSPMADCGPWRKRLLLGTGLLGAGLTASIIVLPVGADRDGVLWPLIGLYMIVTNTLFGASIVFYNAYLPVLVDAHPDLEELLLHQAEEELTRKPPAALPGPTASAPAASSASSSSPASLLSPVSTPLNAVTTSQPSEKELLDAQHNLREQLTNSMSMKGFMVGYAGGISSLLVCAVVLVATGVMQGKSTATAYAICIGIGGIWWFAGTLPLIFFLKKRPTGVVHDDAGFSYSGSFCKDFASGVASLPRTIRTVWNHTMAYRFLLLWFFFSDGVSTTASVGLIFAKRQMCVGTLGQFALAIEIPITALLGGLFFLKVQNFFNLRTKFMIILLLAINCGLVVYCLLGNIEALPFGMKKQIEIWFFAAIYGSCLGAIQSFSRTLFSNFVPVGFESEFFGFFEIADKGSSWIGPIIVAVLSNSGDVRNSFWYLAFATGIPAILMYFFIDDTITTRIIEVDLDAEEEVVEGQVMEGHRRPSRVRTRSVVSVNQVSSVSLDSSF